MTHDITSPVFVEQHAIKNRLNAKREDYKLKLSGGDPLELNISMSDLFDAEILSILNSSSEFFNARDDVAVLALGGYGRREVGPYSDADLLFLYHESSHEAARCLAHSVLYPLWNGGIESGGATRTVAECEELFAKDARALTAMMEARLLAGSKDLFDELISKLREYFSSRTRLRDYVEKKLHERTECRGRFRDVLYSLQPNLKDGEGGIRDHHSLVWMHRALELGCVAGSNKIAMLTADMRPFLSAIWKIRAALHIIEGRRNDVLSHSVQPAVAKLLDIGPSAGSRPEEVMLGSYFMNSSHLYLSCRAAFDSVEKLISPSFLPAALLAPFKLDRGRVTTSMKSLVADPFSELDVFVKASRKNEDVGAETLYSISRLPAISTADASCEPACERLRRMFSSHRGLWRALLSMLESRRLEVYFPEVSDMQYLVQRDGLHSYSAGMHSIMAVRELEALFASKPESGAMKHALSQVKRREVLNLATAFHDIGKGEGSGHQDRGAILVARLCERLGLCANDVLDVSTLVRSHLLMSSIAFKRDISDQLLLEKFCQTVKTPELLAMLYLLTIADIKAVGPRTWNKWKQGLLDELYTRTLSAVTSSDAAPEVVVQEAEKARKRVSVFLGSSFDSKDMDDFLNGLPQRYIFSVAPETVAAQIMMSEKVKDNVCEILTTLRDVPDKSCHEFSIVTRDRPALFVSIAGVLASFGANIVDAQLFTTTSGVAVDLFSLTDANHRMIQDHEVWERIRGSLEDIVRGKRTVADIVGNKFARRFLSSRTAMPAKIRIDNEVSATHTVVEVEATDRMGLLYSISGALAGLELEIQRAMISTQVDRVIDVFYVVDGEGDKIKDLDLLDKIKFRINNAIME